MIGANKGKLNKTNRCRVDGANKSGMGEANKSKIHKTNIKVNNKANVKPVTSTDKSVDNGNKVINQYATFANLAFAVFATTNYDCIFHLAISKKIL